MIDERRPFAPFAIWNKSPELGLIDNVYILPAGKIDFEGSSSDTQTQNCSVHLGITIVYTSYRKFI